MGRPSPNKKILEDSETPDAKYVRRTKDDRWEYGYCKRVALHTEYRINGVADTMREAEDAIGMGQPKAGLRNYDQMMPRARSHFYGST